jgi:uncharacterized RDD family membrane protein YckC
MSINNRKKLNQSKPALYATFGKRVIAFITDLFMIGIPISIIIMLVFGYDAVHSAGGVDLLVDAENAKKNAPSPISSIAQILLSFIAYIWFWKNSGQTPGKKMFNIKVVDSKTLQNASWIQLIVRFIGYFISMITLIGFFTGVFRKDNRTLHDLLSRTAVIVCEE